MKFIEWSSDMSVGSELLDGHHKILIDCLNQLHPLLDTTGRDAEVNAVLAKLEDFVLIHFSEEEQCMKRAGYPDWVPHKAQHDGMYDIVFNLKSDVEHGRALNTQQLFQTIYKWLLEHILGEDRKYMSYLANPLEESKSVWHRSNGKPY